MKAYVGLPQVSWPQVLCLWEAGGQAGILSIQVTLPAPLGRLTAWVLGP